MKNFRRTAGVAVVLAGSLVMTGVGAAFAEEAPAVDAGLVAESTADMQASEFTTNNNDTARGETDLGHVYVGLAITDGAIDDANSNWAAEDTDGSDGYDLEFNNDVEGEGFTALRVFGEANVTASGNLHLHDEGDGTYASDFTGVGVGITAVDGATVTVKDMNYASEGFARSFAIVQGANMIIENSDIVAYGNDPFYDTYDGYYNSASTTKMVSPPWVLGISGGIRTVNLLGINSTLAVADSTIKAGGWGVLSTDGCTEPYYYLFNSSIRNLSEAEGGTDSGWKILGYEETAYGSGYATFYIGGAVQNFYGVDISGATYVAMLSGGEGFYQSLKAGETYEAVKSGSDEVLYTYTATEDKNTTTNTVFGFMSQSSGTINVLEGTVMNTEDAVVLYKAADVDWNFSGAELNPANGVILQLMDNDDPTIGGFDPFGTYFVEEAGFPTTPYVTDASYEFTTDTAVDPEKTYYIAVDDDYEEVTDPIDGNIMMYYELTSPGNNGSLNLANGEYEGDVFNASGYYEQAADGLTVNIAADATLTGDIALASHVHGLWIGDRNVDDIIAAIDEANAKHATIEGYYADLEDIEYVFLNADLEVTENKDDAVAIQFTKFATPEYYLVGHVINKVYYNGESTLDVVVEGTWKPETESLVTYLEVAEGAHVFAEIVDNGNGSFTLTPSDTELAAGTYGNKFIYVAASSDSSGDSEGSGESAGEAAEGADEDADSEGGEAADSEGAEAPAEDAAPAEGAESDGESADSEGAEAPAEGAESDGESADSEGAEAPQN